MGSQPAIGVLGGTFDPVHLGHTAIVRSFLASPMVDELWILLTPSPPHKERPDITPWNLRMEMLKAAFDGVDGVRISDLERRLDTPSYTWRTLRHLKEQYPDREFRLCIGGDSLADFTRWENWREILRMVSLVVAERPSDDPVRVPEPLREHATFVEHTPVGISSSRIRQQIRSGGNADEWLPEGVGRIIERHNLYRNGKNG